jgi:hypothetical protein
MPQNMDETVSRASRPRVPRASCPRECCPNSAGKMPATRQSRFHTRSPPRRLAAAVLEFLLRVAPPRRPSRQDLQGAEFSTHPGGKGLRFTRRLREALRRRWLRLER